MDNFDEYLRQGEPGKAEKAKNWKTAIGLQEVDGLKPSEYLIETAKQNIEGDITNNLFANYSWYFRNALLRANYEDLSKGIYRTEKFLIRFLSNLLVNGNYALKNRQMHILADTVNDTVNRRIDTVNDTVFSLIKQDNKITANEISGRLKMSVSTVRRKIKELRNNGKIERIGSDKTGYWRITE